MLDFSKIKCVIKGGGDIGSGVAASLYAAGFTVVILECADPTAVRRTVAFSTAVSEGFIEIEGTTAKKTEINEVAPRIGVEKLDFIPVLIDETWRSVSRFKPHILIDAIVNKHNHGTAMADAPFVVALGPGFEAGKDCHAVIETNRGHNLGRIIYSGPAEENTGKPGSINGASIERIMRTRVEGVFRTDKRIGDIVKKGDIVGHLGNITFRAQIGGVIRGLLPDNFKAKFYTKLGDIDPRGDRSFCYSISDKSRAIGRAVLEAVMRRINQSPTDFPI